MSKPTLYKVTCDKYEVITEDVYRMEMYVASFLMDNEEVVVKRLR
ncbi:hypothetical protein SAMN05216416_0045 [Streptococcus equinus]|nr:hypothetical protein SAMN05216416_0045 [Streptococcus equinus]